MSSQEYKPASEMTPEERGEAFSKWIKIGDEKRRAERLLLESSLSSLEARKALVKLVTSSLRNFIPAICMDEAVESLQEAFNDHSPDAKEE